MLLHIHGLNWIWTTKHKHFEKTVKLPFKNFGQKSINIKVYKFHFIGQRKKNSSLEISYYLTKKSKHLSFKISYFWTKKLNIKVSKFHIHCFLKRNCCHLSEFFLCLLTFIWLQCSFGNIAVIHSRFNKRAITQQKIQNQDFTGIQ